MKLAFRLLAPLALALVALPARAQQEETAPQALVVTVENRTAAAEAEGGAPRADEATRPGDVLRYRLTFHNVAGRPIRGVKLENPVAAGLLFVGGSARSSRTDARAEFSFDGGRTFSSRPMEEVVENGRRVQRPVAPERFTDVRWTIDGTVAPDATLTAEFEARLGTLPSRPAPAAPPAAGSSGR